MDKMNYDTHYTKDSFRNEATGAAACCGAA
jgi:hypothetical protein